MKINNILNKRLINRNIIIILHVLHKFYLH